MFSLVSSFNWRERDDLNKVRWIKTSYEMKVFWRNNLLLLPTENAWKKYFKEITWLLNPWTQDTPLRSYSLKAIFTITAKLMQTPSKASKSKDHLNALERRLQLWERGERNSLLLEAETIQQKLTSNNIHKYCRYILEAPEIDGKKETSMGHWNCDK